MTHRHPRKMYQETAGFALFTDVNHVMLEGMAVRQVPHLPEVPEIYTNHSADGLAIFEDNPSAVSLFVASKAIQDLVPEYVDDRAEFRQRYGVSSEDTVRANAMDTFEAGFGDLSFPWYFAAGLANAAADVLVEHEAMTQAERDKFTLHDWANIIESRWFSRLCHLMALTTNGTYGGFGRFLTDYERGALDQRLFNKKAIDYMGALEYAERQDPGGEGVVHSSVKLSKMAVRSLRKRMTDNGKTAGCPVARYSIRMPRADAANDPHMQNLIARGTLRVVAERSTDEHIRLIQDRSAIDETLELFAAQLRGYEDRYGTPRTMPGPPHRIRVTHSRDPIVGTPFSPVPPHLQTAEEHPL